MCMTQDMLPFWLLTSGILINYACFISTARSASSCMACSMCLLWRVEKVGKKDVIWFSPDGKEFHSLEDASRHADAHGGSDWCPVFHLILLIEWAWAEKIFAGSKTMELRGDPFSHAPMIIGLGHGGELWGYVTVTGSKEMTAAELARSEGKHCVPKAWWANRYPQTHGWTLESPVQFNETKYYKALRGQVVFAFNRQPCAQKTAQSLPMTPARRAKDDVEDDTPWSSVKRLRAKTAKPDARHVASSSPSSSPSPSPDQASTVSWDDVHKLVLQAWEEHKATFERVSVLAKEWASHLRSHSRTDQQTLRHCVICNAEKCKVLFPLDHWQKPTGGSCSACINTCQKLKVGSRSPFIIKLAGITDVVKGISEVYRKAMSSNTCVCVKCRSKA